MSIEINISISRDAIGKNLYFKTIDELEIWISGEYNKYTWVSSVGKHFSNLIWQSLYTDFSNVRAHLQSIRSNNDRSFPFDGNIQAIIAWFNQVYDKSEKKILLTSSPEFKIIENMKAESQIKAAIFLGHLLSLPNLYQNNIESVEMIEGSFEYLQYIKGLSNKDLDAERKALGDLKSEWDQNLNTYKKNDEKLNLELNTTKTNFENYFSDFQLRLESNLKFHTKELSDIKDTYDQFMSLKAPVDYWTKKQVAHAEKIKHYTYASLIIGTLGGAFLSVILYNIFSDGSKDYWKIGFFILLATLFFWIMRILIKLLLSNIHLETDANERTVMCKTYLSLIRDKSGLNDDDKKLILTALFRPSVNGIINDDGIPPGLYDIFSKAISK